MPKKALDRAKLTKLFDQGLEEARGSSAEANTKAEGNSLSPVRPSSNGRSPKKALVKAALPEKMFLSFTPELTSALYRFQVEFREQHPELTRNQTRISASVEHLLRKALSLKPLV